VNGVSLLELDGKPMRVSLTDKTGRRFNQDECGTTAIEYALIAAGVSIAILTAVSTLGQKIMDTFYVALSSLF
jgi:pilus assembly protein Flp/PilA